MTSPTSISVRGRVGGRLTPKAVLVVASLLGVTTVACSDDQPIAPEKGVQQNLSERSFSVVPPAEWSDGRSGFVPPDYSEEAERKLVDQLFAVVTAEQRRELERMFVTDESKVYAVNGNAEAAQLLGRIYAIRDARHEAEYRGEMRRAALRYRSPVTFVLIDDFGASRVRARVLRDNGMGDNRVILSRATATAETVNAAVQLLNKSRLRHGEIPARPVTLILSDRTRPSDPAPEQRSWCDGILAQLQAAPLREIPGVGRARAISVTIPPVELSNM